MTQEPALLTDYKNRVLPALREKHGYSNVHQIPKITKVVINTCIGSAPDVKESLEIARTELTTITYPTQSSNSWQTCCDLFF
jgi:large subunit ribosomal protein L5